MSPAKKLPSWTKLPVFAVWAGATLLTSCGPSRTELNQAFDSCYAQNVSPLDRQGEQLIALADNLSQLPLAPRMTVSEFNLLLELVNDRLPTVPSSGTLTLQEWESYIWSQLLPQVWDEADVKYGQCDRAYSGR